MATKRERLDEMLRRLKLAAPFTDGDLARLTLEVVMRAVEDELSGIPEDPNADTALRSDGRMYPPHNRFEVASGHRRVRLFKQTRHQTAIGENGSLRITRSDGTVEIDLPGSDGRTVADLSAEREDEPR